MRPEHPFFHFTLTPPDDCSVCGYKGEKLPPFNLCTCCGYANVPKETRPMHGAKGMRPQHELEEFLLDLQAELWAARIRRDDQEFQRTFGRIDALNWALGRPNTIQGDKTDAT